MPRIRSSGLYVNGPPKPLTRCEIQLEGHWQVAEAGTALRHAGAPLRCPSCHGELAMHRVYHGRGGAYFRHLRAHAGCPERLVQFSGQLSRHPDALG